MLNPSCIHIDLQKCCRLYGATKHYQQKIPNELGIYHYMYSEGAVHKVPARHTYIQFLNEFLTTEPQECRRKTEEMRTKLARLPHRKSLDQFDFSVQPSIDKRHGRLLHHAHVINIRGQTCRLKDWQKAGVQTVPPEGYSGGR